MSLKDGLLIRNVFGDGTFETISLVQIKRLSKTLWFV